MQPAPWKTPPWSAGRRLALDEEGRLALLSNCATKGLFAANIHKTKKASMLVLISMIQCVELMARPILTNVNYVPKS
ncbi:hypothetical protein L345_11000, partial [Ophiophagus hannah]